MTTAPSAAPTGRALGLGLDILVMAVITIGSVMVFSASQAASLGWFAHLVPPARMLFLVLVATFLLRRRGETWREVGLARPRRIWATPLIAIIGYVTAYLLVGVMVAVLFPVWHLPRPGVGPLGHLKGNLGEYLFWLIPVTWGSAAFGEEMLFRGFFFSRLLSMFPASRVAVAAAVLLQALLFGSLHLYLGVSGALVAGLMGIVLGAVYLFSGRNLWAGIILHGLIDSTTITVVFLGLAKV